MKVWETVRRQYGPSSHQIPSPKFHVQEEISDLVELVALATNVTKKGATPLVVGDAAIDTARVSTAGLAVVTVAAAVDWWAAAEPQEVRTVRETIETSKKEKLVIATIGRHLLTAVGTVNIFASSMHKVGESAWKIAGPRITC